MPSTVPSGLRLELSRSRIIEGKDGEFGEWMEMLNNRYDQALQRFLLSDRFFEATFRHREADGSLWIYHLSLTGEIGGGLNESHRIDADHAAFSYRVKEPGWEELEPKFMLTPGHILAAMTTWGHTGNQ